MPTTWGYGPKSFEIGPGTSVVQLNVPHRGTIKSINLQQVGGAEDGSFKLYDSQQAANVFSGSSSSSAVDGGDPAVNQICENKQITNGKFVAFDLDIKYINRDGTPTNPIRRLWMVIETDEAGGNTEWSLSMTIDPVDLNS